MSTVFDVGYNLRVAYLNAPGLPVANTPLTGSGAKNIQLTVGKTYRLQAQGAGVYIGFGATAAAADTNSATSVGEFLDGTSYEVKQFTVLNAATQYLSRTPISGTTDLRIWEVQPP